MKYIYLFLLLQISNLVFSQPTFTIDKIYFTGEKIHKVSAGNNGEAWIIKGNDRRQIAMVDQQNTEREMSAAFQSKTKAAFSEITVLNNGQVLAGTYNDNLFHFNGSVVSKLKVDPVINSMQYDRFNDRIMVGTGTTLFEASSNLQFKPAFETNKGAQIYSYSTGTMMYKLFDTTVYSRCNPVPDSSMEIRTISMYYGGISFSLANFPYDYLPEDQKVLTAFAPLVDNGPNYIYWGTTDGLRKRFWACNYVAEKFLPGHRVSAIQDLKYNPRELNGGIHNIDAVNMERRFMLFGTDKGLYLTNVKYFYDNDPIVAVPGLEHLSINDIDTDMCSGTVWLATETGLVKLKADYSQVPKTVKISISATGTQKVCFDKPYTLSATPNPYATYQWQQNGKDVPQATQSSYNATTPGTYRLIMKNVCSQDNFYSDPVVLQADSAVSVRLDSPKKIILCGKDQTVISSTWENATTGIWYKNNRPIANTNQAQLMVSEAGIYKVKVANCNGNFAFSDSVTVIKSFLPKPIITASNNNPCAGELVKLTTAKTSNSILWYKDQQLITNENAASLMVQQEGVYQASYRDDNNCETFSEPLPVKFNTSPTLNIRLSTSLPVCEGNIVMLTAETNVNQYEWSTGSKSATIEVSESGLYWVKVKADNGCETQASKHITVNPNPSITLPTDTVFCEGLREGLVLNAGSPVNSYFLNNIAQNNNLIRFDKSGVYQIKSVSPSGCSTEKQISIRNECAALTFSNIITPNGDGLNEKFVVKNLLPGCELRVMDRFGQTVYQTDNYKNEWGDTKVPPGVYYYLLTSKFFGRSWKGWVEVMN